MTAFEAFFAEIEAEAQAEGPEAVAELEAFRLHFSLARQLAAQQPAHRSEAHRASRRHPTRSGLEDPGAS